LQSKLRGIKLVDEKEVTKTFYLGGTVSNNFRSVKPSFWKKERKDGLGFRESAKELQARMGQRLRSRDQDRGENLQIKKHSRWPE